MILAIRLPQANTAPLATERYQCVACAAVASQTQEATAKDAALEVRRKFVFDELRQAVYLGDECLIVPAHQPVERRLFGTAPLVVR